MIAKKMISNIISILVISTFMLAQVGPVYAADTGSISGVIKDADNNPIIGTQIQVRAVLKSDNSQVAFTMSNPADGTYLLADLPLDTDLAVIASDEDPDSDGFAGQYFSDAWIDWAETIVLTSVNPDRAGVNFSLKDGSSVAVETLTFNVRSGRLLEDLNLRKSIAYGTDRQAILDGVFVPEGSNGEIMHTMVSPNAWYLADPADLTIYNYNKAQAQTILSDAGWTDTDADDIRENASNEELTLDFITVMRPASMAAAELFKSQMLEIGILVNVSTYPNNGFWDRLTTGDFDIAEFGWGLADDYDELLNAYNTGDELNFGGFESATMGGYFDTAHQAKLTGDLSAFEGNASDWQIAFTEELPALPMFTRSGSLRPLPTFGVRANEERVEGWDWQDGSTVTIEIDHDDDGTPEISRTALVGPASWNPDEIRFEYDFRGEYDILPGDKITVTDGTITKETYVSIVSITEIDVNADTASGVSVPETNVDVAVCNQSGCYNRHVVAAAVTGVWHADFAHAGPGDDEQDIVDVAPWDWVDASYRDFDEDSTSYGIGIPNPRFQVRANEDRVEGSEWEIGDTLTIEVSRPGDTISDTVVVGTAPWDANQSYFDFRFDGAFDILPGDLVSVTDGTTTKTTTVTSLSYTAIDMDLNIVSGLASPGAEVNIWACEPNGGDCHNRHITADAVDGTWQADFGNVGTQSDEQTTLDFAPGTWIDSEELDVDFDSTMYGYNIPNPFIEADRDRNWVHARDWPNGTLMTMEIDDVTNGLGGVDYIDTATMAQAPWNPGDPNDIVADFDMSGFTLKAGDVITVTGDMDGSPVSKELVISPLQVTSFDVDADTISGLTTPGAQVEVCVNREFDCLSRNVTADAITGAWTANYDPDHDLQRGQNGWVAEYDPEADRNWHDWDIPNPHMDAWFDGDSISAYGWPDGDEITLSIEDPLTLVSPDYTTTATVGISPWDPNQTVVDFNLAGVFDFAPGMVITIESSFATKQMTVLPLSVTQINLSTDVVGGLTAPNQGMWMYYPDSCCRVFQSNASGVWQVDYSVIGPGGEPVVDIIPGSSGAINANDADGDNTSLGWTAPDYPETLSIQRASANPTSADSVDFTVTFTELVAGVDINDFTPYTTGSITGVSVAAVTPVSGSVYTVTVAVGFGSGTLRLDIPSSATIVDTYGNSLIGLPYTSGQAYDVNKIIPDTTPPSVVSNLRANPSPSNAASLDFTVTFSEAVTGVAVNDFAATVTGAISGASVTSVTPVSASIYTVTVNTGSGNGNLRLDIPSSATIADLAANPLTGLPYTTGQVYEINKTIPDTTPPSVVSNLRANPSPSNAASLDFTVTFSEAVTGVAVNDFAATVTGAISGASVTSVTPVSASVYTVTVNTGSGNGTLRLDIPSSATIADLAANPLTGLPYTTGQVYEINKTIPDTTPPAVVSNVRANPSPSNAASLDFTVTFSEAVTGVAVNDFAATVTGAISGASVTSVTPVSASVYTVTVNTGSGNGNLRLDIPSSATIADLAANPLTGLPYTTGQVYQIRTQTFSDVPVSYWAWQYIERLYKAGITGGCATSPSLTYCPDSTVTRAQMAVFLEKGIQGSDFKPPSASGTRFTDVPSTYWAAAWIEQLAKDGITGGCGEGIYCPDSVVTRAQMAVFLLKSKYGADYVPPALGDSGSGFTDVPAGHWAAPWIKQLAAEGITGGCGAGVYCPETAVTRAQMAVFLVKAFNLP